MNKPVYQPFLNGQWRLAMGLKPLKLSDWIEIDRHFSEQLRLKNQLLTDRHSEVFGSISGSKAGQQEVLELLVAHLLRYFPQHYQRSDDALLNATTGEVWQLANFQENPLDLAGRLVQEDLCLMSSRAEGYVLTAGSVCFPSRWRLGEKLGQPIAQIHSGVPGYAEKLERPVDGFFDRLQVDRPGCRLNWSIVDVPDLHLTGHKGKPELNEQITPDNAGEKLWLRIERQTLRRLPNSNDILFTIRTYIHPLDSLADDPTAARDLAAAIQQIPIAMQIYKDLISVRAALLGYLSRVGAAV